jgi:hypothetical protein
MIGRIALLLACLAGPAAAQQPSLAAAAEQVRAAWLGHDARGVVGRSSGILLQIPGADPSSPLGRSQAVELLRRYLRSVVECSVAVKTVREVELGKGFVELERRYQVVGTSDERRETVFLGFRRAGDSWMLAELRTAP